MILRRLIFRSEPLTAEVFPGRFLCGAFGFHPLFRRGFVVRTLLDDAAKGINLLENVGSGKFLGASHP